MRVRLDKKATAICLLVVPGVRADSQKVLLAVKNACPREGGDGRRDGAGLGGAVPGDLIERGLRKPEFPIVDGGSGLERALAELWSDVPTQRRTVHKHRNLLAHAPERRLLAATGQASRPRPRCPPPARGHG